MNLKERILNAIKNDRVIYWEKRPKNLGRSVFDAAFANNPSLLQQSKQPRLSNGGEHGHDGEESVYICKVIISGLGKSVTYYLKFFFWPKGSKHEEQGIEVQSFKPWSDSDV